MIKSTTPKIYTPQDGSCVLNLDVRDVRNSKIYDRSGKGNHGTITGATIKATNYSIPVLNFDGVDDFVDCGNDNSIKIIGEITINTIFNSNNLAGDHCIVRKLPFIYNIITTGDNIRFEIGHDWAGSQLFTTGLNLKAGRNYFVSCTYDESNMKIFVNGIEKASKAETLILSYPNDDNLIIGIVPINTEPFSGNISFVEILNRKLSASEISQQFNQIRHIYGM
ncbi:MAG: LamG domain-containing protein [Patescibacteria group bacterium]|nr:LamG domain-containing protein [Patescibacteria group bacterium]